MDKTDDYSKNTGNESATLPGPASYEEELKDYSITGEDNVIENMPETHPEPSPDK